MEPHNDIRIIACVDTNMGLSRMGDIPWRIVEDMQYFKQMTTGDGRNAVIMGRRTYESIRIHTPGGYLRNRMNIVVSGSMKEAGNIIICDTLQKAVAAASECKVIWIIGGSMLYAEALQTLPIARMHMTTINHKYDCDNFFPYHLIEETDDYEPLETHRWLDQSLGGVVYVEIEVLCNLKLTK